MNVVVIVPTGLGAEIGGHAGDANPVIKLFASICDTVVTHPNVVNASNINEMPENTFYVEGSILDRFLSGDIGLKQPHHNKILLAVNKLDNDLINSVSAARVTLGADIDVLVLDIPLTMKAYYNSDGMATGEVGGVAQLVSQVSRYEFDALALATPIDVDNDIAMQYVLNGGVNPWGGR